jgi:hypothetical protein
VTETRPWWHRRPRHPVLLAYFGIGLILAGAMFGDAARGGSGTCAYVETRLFQPRNAPEGLAVTTALWPAVLIAMQSSGCRLI